MSSPDRGAVAITLLQAAVLETGFPANVPDTPANQALFADIQDSIEAMPPGVVPDIPWDYSAGADPEASRSGLADGEPDDAP